MDYSKIKGNSANADVPFFKVPETGDILRDARTVHNYELYRKEYKRATGVMPELDKINNPNCAILADNVFLPEDAKKDRKKSFVSGLKDAGSGIGNMFVGGDASDMVGGLVSAMSKNIGAEFYPDFEVAFTKAVEKYKYAYSLLCSYDLDFIDSLPVGSNYPMENLGWEKSANGNYYEGTWQNGRLLYGLMRSGNGSFTFVGTFGANDEPEEGVMYDGDYRMGLFKDAKLDCVHGIQITTHCDENSRYAVFVGGFEDDELNGDIIYLVASASDDTVALYKDTFNYGEVQKKSIIQRSKETREAQGKTKLGKINKAYRKIMLWVLAVLIPVATIYAISSGIKTNIIEILIIVAIEVALILVATGKWKTLFNGKK